MNNGRKIRKCEYTFRPSIPYDSSDTCHREEIEQLKAKYLSPSKEGTESRKEAEESLPSLTKKRSPSPVVYGKKSKRNREDTDKKEKREKKHKKGRKEKKEKKSKKSKKSKKVSEKSITCVHVMMSL